MVLFVLNLKYRIYVGGKNPYFYPIGYTVCSIGLHQMFKEVSGGIFNPALSIAQICWQNLTYRYEIGSDQSYWTPDYAVCYIMAPWIGAFMAGNVFNFQKRLLRRMDTGVYDEPLSTEEEEGERFTFNIGKQIDDFKKTTERQLRIGNTKKAPGRIPRGEQSTLTVEKSRI